MMKSRCEFGLLIKCKNEQAPFREDAGKKLCQKHYQKYKTVHKFDRYHS